MANRDARKAGRRSAQLAKLDAKGVEEAAFFWSCAKAARPRSHGAAGELFGKQLAAGINFAAYDAIPVKVALPAGLTGSAEVPALTSFGSLAGRVPGFLSENVKRMGYSVPTPIQKHAVGCGPPAPTTSHKRATSQSLVL